MIKRRKNLLYFLLDSEQDARQIRSVRGKVIASNRMGEKLFKNNANPFSFLQDSLQPEKVEKLVLAYQQQCNIDTQIETPEQTYQISIKKVGKNILLIAKDISDSLRFEAVYRREYSLLNESMALMPAGFFIADMDGKIRFANERLLQWTKTNPDTLYKTPLSSLFKDKIPMSDAWSGIVELKTDKKKGLMCRLQQSVFEQDGQTLTEGVLTEIEQEENKTKKWLHHSDFMSKAPLPIIIIDALDNSIIECNPAFCKTIGQTASDLKEQTLHRFLDSASQEVLPLKLSKLTMKAQRFEKCELTLRAKNAEEKVFMAYIEPIERDVADTDKEISAFAFFLTDLNERKDLQMQMAHAQKMQAMGQLAGGVAHDFNNLLTAIIGFSDLLLQKHAMGDPSFADIMQIKHNANRASGLVSQLLTFSKKKPLKPKLINLSDAFSQLSELLHRGIGPKVSLSYEYGSDLGYVKVDSNQLMQVFLNLAVNARDAMPSGGQLSIKTHIETIDKPKNIGNDTIIPATYIVIDVSDTGCGIPKENLSRIFEPFFSTKEGIAGSGTGLGLSTVYGIISQSDGYIHVKSTVGKGTTFTIYLPRFDEPDESVQEDKNQNKTPVIAPQKATIFLVEDEDAVRAFSARALQNKGYSVVEFPNADLAFEAISAGKPFDLLLTDMVMPGSMDGETLAKLTKEKKPDAKIILMSGYSEDFARHGKDESKTFSFLPKPFSLAQLLEKIHTVLCA